MEDRRPTERDVALKRFDKSPNEYICWRYEFGEDKEAESKVTLEVSDEEQKLMNKPFDVPVTTADGQKKKEKRVVEKLVSRRKDKKSFVYEIKWKNMTMDFNTIKFALCEQAAI